MNTEVLHNAVAGSLAGTNSFPDVVRVLTEEGVESYRADLVRLEETFYMPDGATHVESLDFPRRPIGEQFRSADVIAAIRDAQAGKCQYREFLHRVMDAGTSSYVVHIRGRKVIYFGRHGEFHIEEFPGAKS